MSRGKKCKTSSLKEGWTTRAESLHDLLTSGTSLSQPDIIESSSSDDEGNFSSKGKAILPKVQEVSSLRTKLLVSFPQDSFDSPQRKKLEIVRHASSKSSTTSRSSCSKHLNHPQGIQPGTKTITGQTKTTLKKGSRNKEGDRDFSKIGNSDKFIHTSIPTELPVTPSKSETKGSSVKDLTTSPVFASQTRIAPKTKLGCSLKNTVSFDCLQPEEPSSPIIGVSQREKLFQLPASPVLGVSSSISHIGNSVSPIFKISRNASHSEGPTSPVLGTSEKHLIRRIRRNLHGSRSEPPAHFGQSTKLLSDLTESVSSYDDRTPQKDKKGRESIRRRNLYEELSQECSDVCDAIEERESPNKNPSSNVIKGKELLIKTPAFPATKKILSAKTSNDVKKNLIKVSEVPRQIEGFQNGNQFFNDGVTYSQDDPEVEEILSPSSNADDVANEQDAVEELVDVIDCTASPLNDTECNSADELKGSVEPIVSVDSSVSSKETEQAKDSARSGFSWIKALQHRTPEKQLCQSNDYAESAEKKRKKDGYSGRLRRLINSWQSDVQVWLHETCVKSPEIQSPKIEELLLKKYSHISCKDPSILKDPNSYKDFIKKEFVYEKPNKVLCSPGIRSLQGFLIESPYSSPGLTPRAKRDLSLTSKSLKLVIMKVGGNIQMNAALCSVQQESSELLINVKEEIPCKNSLKTDVAEPKEYLVYFSLADHKVPLSFCVGDKVEIHSPWSVLSLSMHKIPVIFTSLFKIDKDDSSSEKVQTLKEETECTNRKVLKRKPPLKYTDRKKVALLKWTCTCLSNSSIPSVACECWEDMPEPGVQCGSIPDDSLLRAQFQIVTSTSQSQEIKQSELQPTWTVLEAIEKCGGISDKLVTISIRAHRVITLSNAQHEIEEWEVIGQDANGIFCVVKIPNRPLVKQLTHLIQEEEGRTWTLTKVNVIERITNTQKPGLFCLISSLHQAYQETIQDNPLLYPLLMDHVSKPSQTYCYVFSVNLGATSALNCQHEVGTVVSLPYYSLQEISKLKNDGQRGSICFYILYRIGSFLYVMGQPGDLSGDKVPSETSVGTSKLRRCSPKAFTKGNTSIFKLSVSKEATLPRWISDSDTVMRNAFVRDVVIKQDCVLIDEYSYIRPQKSEITVTLSSLVKILQPLSSSSRVLDLTVVTGMIQSVDEESAFTWLSCSNCGSGSDEERTVGLCFHCGTENSTFNREYYLEVCIDCSSYLRGSDVKVKLFTAAAKKLLNSSQGIGPGNYESSSLIGRNVGPFVCFVEKVEPLSINRHLYTVRQLPY